MAKTVVELNPDRCVCCYACVAACQDLHYDIDETGPALRRAVRQEDGDGTIRCGSMGCLHCDMALCLAACPTGAIRRDPETGLVIVEEARCVGCRRCQKACPYGVPQFIEAADVYYVAVRYDIVENQNSYESYRATVLLTLRSEDYRAMSDEWIAAKNIRYNEDVIKQYTPQSIYENMTGAGATNALTQP